MIDAWLRIKNIIFFHVFFGPRYLSAKWENRGSVILLHPPPPPTHTRTLIVGVKPQFTTPPVLYLPPPHNNWPVPNVSPGLQVTLRLCTAGEVRGRGLGLELVWGVEGECVTLKAHWGVSTGQGDGSTSGGGGGGGCTYPVAMRGHSFFIPCLTTDNCPFTFLRHCSLHRYVKNNRLKSEVCSCNSHWDIHVKKISVKNALYYFPAA